MDTQNKRARKSRVAARRLFIKEHGLEDSTIPSNYQIHHKDCNPFNNDINNLVMLSRDDHWAVHKKIVFSMESQEDIVRHAYKLIDQTILELSQWLKTL